MFIYFKMSKDVVEKSTIILEEKSKFFSQEFSRKLCLYVITRSR